MANRFGVGSRFHLGVFASANGWHFQDLDRAVNEQKLPIELTALDFRTLQATVVSNSHPTILAGTSELSDLDCVFVRVMPSGTLEQIVFRMDVLNRLKAIGVSVINSPRAVEVAVDKFLSLAILARNKIRVPETHSFQTKVAAQEFLDSVNFQDAPLVLKPLFGSLGIGVRKLSSLDEALEFCAACDEKGEIIYLQRWVDHSGVDFRFFVIGEKVWSIKRTAARGEWLTNVHLGGKPSSYSPTEDEKDLAIQAARATGCEIAGVDVAYDRNTGLPFVLEVNAAPGWKAISSTLNVDFAAEILNHCRTKCLSL